MIISLIVGALVGFVLAMAPGPVSVSTMKMGLEKGLSNGTKLAAGAGALDVIYCIVAMLAATAVISAIQAFFDQHLLATFAFQIICVAALLVYGFVHIRTKKVEINCSSQKAENLSFIQNLKQNGPFFLGVAIALTNIANPTFLPSLTYLSV